MESEGSADTLSDLLSASAPESEESEAQGGGGFEGAMLRLRVLSPDDEEIWLDGISVGFISILYIHRP